MVYFVSSLLGHLCYPLLLPVVWFSWFTHPSTSSPNSQPRGSPLPLSAPNYHWLLQFYFLSLNYWEALINSVWVRCAADAESVLTAVVAPWPLNALLTFVESMRAALPRKRKMAGNLAIHPNCDRIGSSVSVSLSVSLTHTENGSMTTRWRLKEIWLKQNTWVQLFLVISLLKLKSIHTLGGPIKNADTRACFRDPDWNRYQSFLISSPGEPT